MPTIELPPDLPARMKSLRRDEVGRPVPWFVPWVDGKPDFRLMDSPRLVEAIKGELCFICGERLLRSYRGSNAPKGTFVVGPMCVVNRVSAEPPNHWDCALWSSKACPFLTKPAKVRRDGNLPDDATDAAGFMIERNPGVTALVSSNRWRVFKPGLGAEGILFSFDIDTVEFMAEGRIARQSEVMESIETGIDALADMAQQDGGERELAKRLSAALRLVGITTDWTPYPNIRRVLEWMP